MLRRLILAAALAASAAAPASDQDAGPGAATAAPAGTIRVEQDTLIRLMVLNEVSSRTAKPGDRFVLRVDEPVVVGGVTVIPVGAKAWGEIVEAETNGHAGKTGRIGARLLHVEVGGDQIPITGENRDQGEVGSTRIALGVLAFGPLGLLMRGNNAKLKAGEIFNAWLARDMVFDPATAKLTPIPR
jgi:hypothetical protein